MNRKTISFLFLIWLFVECSTIKAEDFKLFGKSERQVVSTEAPNEFSIFRTVYPKGQEKSIGEIPKKELLKEPIKETPNSWRSNLAKAGINVDKSLYGATSSIYWKKSCAGNVCTYWPATEQEFNKGEAVACPAGYRLELNPFSNYWEFKQTSKPRMTYGDAYRMAKQQGKGLVVCNIDDEVLALLHEGQAERIGAIFVRDSNPDLPVGVIYSSYKNGELWQDNVVSPNVRFIMNCSNGSCSTSVQTPTIQQQTPVVPQNRIQNILKGPIDCPPGKQ